MREEEETGNWERCKTRRKNESEMEERREAKDGEA